MSEVKGMIGEGVGMAPQMLGEMGINIGPLLNNIGRSIMVNLSLGDTTVKANLYIKRLPEVLKMIMESVPDGSNDS